MTGSVMSMEYFDVVVVGAGLSGIGAAYHLQDKCPNKSYVILEGREAMGGTWDLFRYPGIRSDSDMHTLGYNFKPWNAEKAIADGPAILEYVEETATENGIDQHIRYSHWVTAADWSSEDNTWTVTARRAGSDESVRIKCNFLLMCSGYYSYEKGHEPDFPGRDRFQGTVVHPQEWPEALDYTDKKVVIIGSGATAMTLAPAMAEEAEQVVMLQRSPTWVVSRPERDVIANGLRRLLPDKLAYAITRWKNVAFQQYIYRRSRTHPEKVRAKLLDMTRKELGPDYDVDTHFTPDYNPWDQRLCLVPNSDLFKSIKSGRTRVVTDHIDTFTEDGIRLQSGETLEADIIVTATGLSLVVLGGAKFTVDGKAIDFSRTFTYKGMMYSGVPNLVLTFGYINASWTLRADLTAEYVCRLIKHMDEKGYKRCVPQLRPEDEAMTERPFITDFPAGYMQRAMPYFPRQGDHAPWINPQNYRRDRKLLRHAALEDGVLQFSGEE